MAETWKQWEGTSVDGKFRLDQFLGGSDHSAVFLTQLPGGAKAAIKFVEVNPQTLAFQRANWEQSIRFSHPHLMQVLGTGQCRLGNLDLLYVVTEYAEENLAQILPDRALSADEVRDTLGPVIETLQALHERGFAHGSLKPSNVMAVQDQLKLSSDQVRALGSPGMADEKTSYAAPEIVSNGAGAPSDAWSLGVMLIEVLTQRVPQLNATGQPVIPANLPVPFQDIATHCLAAVPQDRWSLAQIAERLATSQSVHAEPPSKVPVQKDLNPPVIQRAAFAEGAPRDATPGEFGSPRRLMVSGITFLLVLVGIYAGSQLVHRASREAAGVSAGSPGLTESAKPSEPAAGTKTPDSDVHTDASHPGASAPAKDRTSASAPTSVSSPARILERVEPNVSASARATVSGKIRVRVDLNVDDSGKVRDARLTTPGPSQYFASRALEAARRWTFVPAQVNGQPAPSKWTLRFAFSRRTTDIDAQVTGN